MFDADGDGVLEHSDYDALGRRAVDAFSQSHDSAKAKAVFDGMTRLWQTHLSNLDTDNDQRISRDEFRAGVSANVIGSNGFDTVVGPLVLALASLGDSKERGVLDASAFNRLMGAFGLDEATTAQAFARIDRDNDGRITSAEYVQAWRDFYLAADTNTPGSWLLGDPR